MKLTEAEVADVQEMLDKMIRYMKDTATGEQVGLVPGREALARRLVEQSIDLLKEAGTISEKDANADTSPLAIASMALFVTANSFCHFNERALRDALETIEMAMVVTDTVFEKLGKEKFAELTKAADKDDIERVNQILAEAGPAGLLLRLAHAAKKLKKNGEPEAKDPYSGAFSGWAKTPKKG